MSASKGWIGVDLDGTLATYDKWRGVDHVGEPVPRMVERVKTWLAEGKRVKIFTARCAPHVDRVSQAEVIVPIEQWCEKHLGRVLPIVYAKDFEMIELWDDRCVQVEPNTGITIAEQLDACASQAGDIIGQILDDVDTCNEQKDLRLSRLVSELRAKLLQ